MNKFTIEADGGSLEVELVRLESGGGNKLVIGGYWLNCYRDADEFFNIVRKAYERPAEQPKPARKIVQVRVHDSEFFTLCNDDTLWRLNTLNEWQQLPPIPQDTAMRLIDPQPMETLPKEGEVIVQYWFPIGGTATEYVQAWSASAVRYCMREEHPYEFTAWSYTATTKPEEHQ